MPFNYFLCNFPGRFPASGSNCSTLCTVLCVWHCALELMFLSSSLLSRVLFCSSFSLLISIPLYARTTVYAPASRCWTYFQAWAIRSKAALNIAVLTLWRTCTLTSPGAGLQAVMDHWSSRFMGGVFASQPI